MNVGIILDELPGIIGFFRDDVPRAFPSILGPRPAGDKKARVAHEDPRAALRREFAAANSTAKAALAEYRRLAEEEWLPRSQAEFAIGEAKFRAKLPPRR